MKNNFFKIGKKLSFIAIAASMLMGLSANAVDLEDTDIIEDLPTAIQNGSFEDPQWNRYISDWDSITDYKTQAYLENRATSGFYWKTTASDDNMELWNADKFKTIYGWQAQNFSAADENQFAELNADEASTLYQNIQTVPGAVFKWGLAHRGRVSTNTMALIIGPAQTDSSIEKQKSGKDPFMKMIDWVQNTGEYENINHTDGCSDAFVVYSKPLTSDVTSTDDYFTYTAGVQGYDHKWKCWIITDEGGKTAPWGHYGLNALAEHDSPSYDYTYEVPNGQTATIFAFVSIAGDNEEPINTLGNYLDGIEFEKAYPLRVATTGGGTGTVTADHDSEYNTNFPDNVNVTTDSFRRYLDGTEVTITATPDTETKEHKFLGAFIDGYFHKVDAKDDNGDPYFTYDKDSNTYTHTVKVTSPMYVQLVFSAPSTVTYDPNGGLFRNLLDDTEITMSLGGDEDTDSDTSDVNEEYKVWTNKEPAVPKPENEGKIQFIGWYFARAINTSEGVTHTGALIEPNTVHSVTYYTNDELIISYNSTSNDDTHNDRVSAADGVTFIAEWEYDQRAIATRTTTVNGTDYTPSTDGGTVEMTISDIDGESDSVRSVNTDNETEYGWGRLRDLVAMTATAKPGYKFDGWYDAEDGGNLISHGTYYTYNVAEPVTVYARFSPTEPISTPTPTPTPVVLKPYVSFVSEAETPETTIAPFNEGSHVKYNGNTISSGGTGGAKVYGNTISTGFVLQIEGDGQSADYCTWDITIPYENTYVKTDNAVTNYGFELGETPILTDTPDAKANNGAIYEATDNTVDLKLFKNTTTFTTEGAIIYGIVIDNIYAPDATATVVLTTDAPESEEYKDIDNIGNVVNADSAENYQTSDDNIYNK